MLVFSTVPPCRVLQRCRRSLSCGLSAALLLAACAGSPPSSTRRDAVQRPLAPEAASGYQEKPTALAQRHMIVADHPLASQAGQTILREGGSAVDAAIAAGMVLTVVAPQASGIGGGGLMLHFDGQHIQAFDGRETAPAAATSALFLNAQGQALGFYEGVVGGRSVGVPGLMRMLELAHRQHGKLPWARLFTPALELAEHGFAISPRLATLLALDPHLKRNPDAAALYYQADGSAKPAGTILRNPALAATLRSLAEHGAQILYQGPLAEAIVQAVRKHPSNPGLLSLSDLYHYQAKARNALCRPYRVWQVCGMPPPSSGGIAVAQILGILATQNMAGFAPQRTPQGFAHSVESAHWLSEAERLAYADRARYVADSDFVPLPGGSADSLLDKHYLAQRASLIQTRSMGTAPAGQPQGASLHQADDRSPEFKATTHLSVVDAQGRAVTLTSSIEDAFGARLMVGGFLLNNQLTDFSFTPQNQTGAVANRVQGGKRPRSSMSPTLVFRQADGGLEMVLGSPGGAAIIHYVAQSLIAYLDWQLPLAEVVKLPHISSRNGTTDIELGRISSTLQAGLKERGHVLREIPQTSGLHIISRAPPSSGQRWQGAADPRREGLALGD